MKVLITGASGLLGGYIASELNSDYELILMSHNNRVSDTICDITDESEVKRLIAFCKPDIVIHAGAISDVESCEDNPYLAHNVNTIGTLNLAYYSSQLDLIFFYISSDYVFKGDKREPYTEEDRPCPYSIYGQTKYAGENFVSYFLSKHYILRTGLLYGDNGDPIMNIYNKIKDSLEINVAEDQYMSATYALDFARYLKVLLSRVIKDDFKDLNFGIYNIVNKGVMSRYELALKIADICGLDNSTVKPSRLRDISKNTKRPEYSALNIDKFERDFRVKLRPCSEALFEYLDNCEVNI